MPGCGVGWREIAEIMIGEERPLVCIEMPRRNTNGGGSYEVTVTSVEL